MAVLDDQDEKHDLLIVEKSGCMSKVRKMEAPKYGIGEWVALNQGNGSFEIYKVSSVRVLHGSWIYECMPGGIQRCNPGVGELTVREFGESILSPMSQTDPILKLSIGPIAKAVAEMILPVFQEKIEETALAVAKRRYVSTQQLMDLLDISRPTIIEYEKKGVLKSYRIGNLKRFRLDEVNEALVHNQTSKTSKP